MHQTQNHAVRNRRSALSFCWNHEGLGHASRLTAVHSALAAEGWDSRFLVEHPQRLISDSGVPQVTIPSYRGCLRGDDWWGGAGDSDLCRRVVAAAFEPRPAVIIHDVVVHDAVYAEAVATGARQVYLARPRSDVPDIAAWVLKHAPAIDTVFVLGRPGLRDVRGRLIVRGIENILRQPAEPRAGLWTDEPRPRIVVSPGGGGHAGTGSFLSAALSALAKVTADHSAATVRVILGPYLAETVEVPAGPHAVQVVPYVDANVDLYRDTDLFVGLGGYNTVQEVAASGVRAVLVAAPRAVDDQLLRLRETFADVDQVGVARADADEIAATAEQVLTASGGTSVASPEPARGATEVAEYLTAQQGGVAPQPEAYATGEVVFAGRQFRVDSRVLVPRAKTEVLARLGARAVSEVLGEGGTFVEVGTGSGVVVCTAAGENDNPKVRYVASDVSSAALEVARANAELTGIADRVEFVVADLLDGLPDAGVLVANLPYLDETTALPPEVRAEPRVAVVDRPGEQGLLGTLLGQLAARPVRPRRALFEFDPERIPALVEDALKLFAGESVTADVHHDDQGVARVVVLSWH
jgi:release factor glutamine methyltransferase